MAQSYNTSVILRKAGEIETQNGELKGIIADLASIVDEMSGAWQDNAQKQFASQFAEIRPELEKFCKTIGDFSDKAKKHANDVAADADVL